MTVTDRPEIPDLTIRLHSCVCDRIVMWSAVAGDVEAVHRDPLVALHLVRAKLGDDWPRSDPDIIQERRHGSDSPGLLERIDALESFCHEASDSLGLALWPAETDRS